MTTTFTTEFISFIKKVLNAVEESLTLKIVGVDLSKLTQNIKSSRTELGEKVRTTMEALESASSLVTELQEELTERNKSVIKLKKQYEEFNQLVQVEEKAAHTLIKEMEKTISKGKVKDRIINTAISLATGLIIFILGIYFGPMITELIGVN